MTVTILRSTDGGAPSLANTAGSLITLLDHVLVTTLGWSKPYTGTNKAAYKQPSGTNEFYLRVDDTGTTSARVVGYEAMTTVDAGTNPFPTAAQQSGGMYFGKSSSGSAADWIAVSDGKLVYFFVKYGGTYWTGFVFGDFESYKVSDAYATIIIGDTSTPGNNTPLDDLTGASNGFCTGHYIARSYTQIGSSITAGKITDSGVNNNATVAGTNGMSYPCPIDGGLHQAPIWLCEVSMATGRRGLLPGLWCPMHPAPLTHGDTFDGTGILSGRSFEVITTVAGQLFIETSDTWGGF